MQRHIFHTRGNSLVEVVVCASILSLVSLSFLGTLSVLSKLHERDSLYIKGTLLAEEGLEAVRFIKGAGWNSLSTVPTGEPQYLALSPSSWSLTTEPEIVDGLFYRSLVFTPVERNGADDIVASGGVIDPNTLLAQASVAWNWRGATTTVAYQTYVKNI